MKYYLWILGCAMNYSDAERMAAVLDGLGYERTFREKESDLFIVVSCSVRQSAINRIFGKVKDLKEYRIKNPEFRTILTGCVLEKDRKKLEKVFDVMFEIKDLDKLPTLLPSLREGKADEAISSEKDCHASLAMTGPCNKSSEYLSIQPHYESSFRAYVPISTGCNNFCSYCAVPYTRGREKSRPAEEIIAEVNKLVGNGYKEITLLGQNVNSYGNDLKLEPPASGVQGPGGCAREAVGSYNKSFVDLLLALDKIPGEHRIYFYSNHPKDMTDGLIQTIAGLKHFPPYIHLPLQSGNDEILGKMNRKNTKSEYLNLVQKIRTIIPDLTLTTDIIVGYPGETDAQFADTEEVMKIAKFDMAFIAQYSPRPGTRSAKEPDDVPKEQKIEREKKLQQILAETVLEHNKLLENTIQTVLIDGQKNGKYYGRTEGYKVVEIKTDQPLAIGQFVDVKIEKAESWKLLGFLHTQKAL